MAPQEPAEHSPRSERQQGLRFPHPLMTPPAVQVLLFKAADLGMRLSAAFQSQTGIPFSDVNLQTHNVHQPPWTQFSSLSEVSTLALEFTYLERAAGAWRRMQPCPLGLSLKWKSSMWLSASSCRLELDRCANSTGTAQSVTTPGTCAAAMAPTWSVRKPDICAAEKKPLGLS